MSSLTIAYHEAGHALMTLLCGREVCLVQVGGEDVAGFMMAFSTSGTLRRKAFEDKVLSLQAGFIAQSIHDPSFNLDASGKDIESAMELLRTIHPAPNMALRRYKVLVARCSKMLSSPVNMANLHKLAKVLNERGRLTGPEVRKLLDLP